MANGVEVDNRRGQTAPTLAGMSELLAFKPGVMFDQDIESLLAQDVVAGGLGAVYGLEVSKTHRWNDVKLDMAYAHGRSSRQFEDLNGGEPFHSRLTSGTMPPRRFNGI